MGKIPISYHGGPDGYDSQISLEHIKNKKAGNIMEFIDFEDVPINTTEIEQSVLNIENKMRSNLYAWNGQFSPQLIEALLTHFAKSSDLVFDPFLGSGTVLNECGRQGISAYGTEINPAAYFMAKSYEMINLDFEERELLVVSIDKIISNIISRGLDSDSIIKKLKLSIDNCTESTSQILKLLIILLDVFNNDVNTDFLNKKWSALKSKLNEMPFSKKAIKAYNIDIRGFNLDNEKVDLVIGTVNSFSQNLICHLVASS